MGAEEDAQTYVALEKGAEEDAKKAYEGPRWKYASTAIGEKHEWVKDGTKRFKLILKPDGSATLTYRPTDKSAVFNFLAGPTQGNELVKKNSSKCDFNHPDVQKAADEIKRFIARNRGSHLLASKLETALQHIQPALRRVEETPRRK